ncbi:hypothetical protein B0T13DRAFT_529519 [Neurospora crassa]|nr:hypothetical protein B0T13DRAFT_529519 [Neurospora crassa]
MDNIMNELVAVGPLEGPSSTRSTYTSILTSPKYNDERHRHWFVACRIASTHFGVSQLPDPFRPHDGESVTIAQATAANRIHECYVEGFEDVMMRFYNLGLSRVSTAAHLYALDFSLWMRVCLAGYALGCGDFGVKFHYTKPSAHIGPFSAEYDIFYHAKQTERFRERQMVNGPVTSGTVPFPNAPGGPRHVTATSTNISQPSKEENERPIPQVSATEVNPKSTALQIHGSDKHILDVAIAKANVNQPSKEETEPAHSEVSATEAHPTSTTQTSRASAKRGLDTTDPPALAPQSKRQQPGLSLRTLASVLDRQEVHLPSQAKQESQATTVPAVAQSNSQAKRDTVPDGTICGNRACRRPGHELADCFGPPSNMGDLDGCPFCNTQQHVLDNCPDLPRAGKNKLFDTLIIRRADLPPIRTAISFLDLAAAAKKLHVLAETIPLQKRTARWTYSELKLWQHPNPSRLLLFRDPEFSSDPQVLMAKLYESRDALVSGTTRIDRNTESIPSPIMVVKNQWMAELVPYNKIYQTAKIRVEKRGPYPFGPQDELLRVQKGHREMVQERLFVLLKERYELEPNNKERENSEHKGIQDKEE